jgi:hypothetical protein
MRDERERKEVKRRELENLRATTSSGTEIKLRKESGKTFYMPCVRA